MNHKLVLVSCLLLMLPAVAIAQGTAVDNPMAQSEATQSQQSQGGDTTQIQPLSPNAISQTRVVARSIPAISYPSRGGSSKVDFRGTKLMSQATGSAKVESKANHTDIDSQFEDLNPARNYGPEFLTYVLWAITPEGRPTNLGEIVPKNDGKGSLKATANLQTFGMIVTAEPYFAVTRPSGSFLRI